MNKIFKVIWSKSRNCYVVASELAKGRTKAASAKNASKRAVLATITALMLLPVGGFSYAAATVTDTNGKQQTVVTTEDATVQDSDLVSSKQTIGYNVTQLDGALHKEIAARLGADAAQDKRIDEAAKGISELNTTMGTGFTAINQALVSQGNAIASVQQSMTDQKTSTALHISSSGNLIVGTNENQTVKDLKIRGQLTSGSISTGNITSTGDVSVKGKVEAEAVYDDTTKTANYVVRTNSIGSNLGALDTQAKANAEAIAQETKDR